MVVGIFPDWHLKKITTLHLCNYLAADFFMKKLSVVIVLLALISAANAVGQTKKEVVRYLDDQFKDVKNPNTALYVELGWPEAGAWRAQVYVIASQKLLRDTYYSDSTRKQRQGRMITYDYKGIMVDSAHYVDDKLHGDYYTWYDDGSSEKLFHYYKGNMVDTCVKWSQDGSITYLSITDSNGNGLAKEIYPSGKVQASGKLYNSLRQGKWNVFSTEGQLAMEIAFAQDSVLSTTCYREDGTAAKGDCIFEQPAEFKGGIDGWRKFIGKNLKYPEVAQTRNISGVVRVQFMVSKTGEVYDAIILSSPHESLSEEVLRLMDISPKWQPAIRYNTAVLYRHKQSITFRLR